MNVVSEEIERVLALGPAGTYLDGLAHDIAPDLPVEYPVDKRGHHTFPAIIDAIHTNPRAGGLIVIRNTLAGPLSVNAAAYQDRSLRVLGEVKLDVESNVMGLGTLDEARSIGGKDVALDQVEKFMPELVRVPMDSTAAAAKHIQETGDKTMVAVGSLHLARIYDLNVLARSVQDKPASDDNLNRTTVWITSDKGEWEFDPDSIDHTAQLSGAMIIRAAESNRAGALEWAAREIAEREINLTDFESLYIRGTEDAEFFVIFSGLGSAIADLATSKQAAQHMTTDILGVYNPASVYTS